MNGPDHYRTAEEMIDHAEKLRAMGESGRHSAGVTPEMLASALSITLQGAQVHATLALAMATIDAAHGVRGLGSRQWLETGA